MGLADVAIDRVRVVGLGDRVVGPYEKGDSRYAVVVEAAGVTGAFGPVDELPAALVATSLGQVAVKHLVADHEGLLRRLFTVLGPHGAGLGRWAVGALDCAVWDLHGRLAGRAVAALLSDRPAARVPVYASWLSLDLLSGPAVDAVKRTVGEGFAFTKWSLKGGDDAHKIAAVAGQVAAWAGQRVAVDALGTWDHALAAEIAPLLSADAVLWVEDPLPRTDRAAYTELRERAATLPVAFGERVPHAEEAAALLEHCQPTAFTYDVAWCGGITEARTWLAAAYDAAVPVHLHGRAFLPAVHLAAAFPHVVAAVEYQVVWEPRRQRALDDTLEPDDGHVLLPGGPGLGLEVRW
ncbi:MULTISPECIES: enolase C-terminal domain-like protein [Streptomyces]|uniref:enolase C-terminal domain-like protein n=1 Tax=Streptomyces TaxID=1883 RepID=UPI00287F8D2E|nr:enolase C-terminal domain-like protein [Streptomyces sp. CGMCC 4.1456]WNF67165.1 enolase C-terminal domain-like protein [Streptomyces sp. CGMCC 4.1456]